MDACNLLLGQPRSTLPAIEFFSEQQIWERLLGLTDKALTDVPARFETAVTGELSQKAYQAAVTSHQKDTIKAMDALFEGIQVPDDHIEAPIIWTE